MENSKEELKDLLNVIDDVELIPEDKLEGMDFFDLAYYMQTLNQISTLEEPLKEESEEE